MTKTTEEKPSLERRKHMRNQAICITELCKGFAAEPTTNAGKAMLEMTDYVLELTNYDYLKDQP